MPPDPHEAAAQRRVLLVRLAAWGTVLVLAAIAFTLRAGASTETDHGANGPQLNGQTSQGLPIWAVVEDERVGEVEMKWELRCDNGQDVHSWGGVFRAGTDEFESRDRRFRVEDRTELPATDGWTAHVKVELDGATKPGGRAVEGRAAAVMWFERGGKRGAVCRSGPVSWSAPSPPPAGA